MPNNQQQVLPIGLCFVGVEDQWFTPEGFEATKSCLQWCEAAYLERSINTATTTTSAQKSITNNKKPTSSNYNKMLNAIQTLQSELNQATNTTIGGSLTNMTGASLDLSVTAATLKPQDNSTTTATTTTTTTKKGGSKQNQHNSNNNAATAQEELVTTAATNILSSIQQQQQKDSSSASITQNYESANGAAFFYPLLSPPPPYFPSKFLQDQEKLKINLMKQQEELVKEEMKRMTTTTGTEGSNNNVNNAATNNNTRAGSTPQRGSRPSSTNQAQKPPQQQHQNAEQEDQSSSTATQINMTLANQAMQNLIDASSKDPTTPWSLIQQKLESLTIVRQQQNQSSSSSIVSIESLVETYMDELEAFANRVIENNNNNNNNADDPQVRLIFAPLLHPQLLAAMRLREQQGYSDMFIAHVFITHCVASAADQEQYNISNTNEVLHFVPSTRGFPPGREFVVNPSSPYGQLQLQQQQQNHFAALQQQHQQQRSSSLVLSSAIPVHLQQQQVGATNTITSGRGGASKDTSASLQQQHQNIIIPPAPGTNPQLLSFVINPSSSSPTSTTAASPSSTNKNAGAGAHPEPFVISRSGLPLLMNPNIGSSSNPSIANQVSGIAHSIASNSLIISGSNNNNTGGKSGGGGAGGSKTPRSGRGGGKDKGASLRNKGGNDGNNALQQQDELSPLPADCQVSLSTAVDQVFGQAPFVTTSAQNLQDDEHHHHDEEEGEQQQQQQINSFLIPNVTYCEYNPDYEEERFTAIQQKSQQQQQLSSSYIITPNANNDLMYFFTQAIVDIEHDMQEQYWNPIEEIVAACSRSGTPGGPNHHHPQTNDNNSSCSSTPIPGLSFASTHATAQHQHQHQHQHQQQQYNPSYRPLSQASSTMPMVTVVDNNNDNESSATSPQNNVPPLGSMFHQQHQQQQQQNQNNQSCRITNVPLTSVSSRLPKRLAKNIVSRLLLHHQNQQSKTSSIISSTKIAASTSTPSSCVAAVLDKVKKNIENEAISTEALLVQPVTRMTRLVPANVLKEYNNQNNSNNNSNIHQQQENINAAVVDTSNTVSLTQTANSTMSSGTGGGNNTASMNTTHSTSSSQQQEQQSPSRSYTATSTNSTSTRTTSTTASDQQSQSQQQQHVTIDAAAIAADEKVPFVYHEKVRPSSSPSPSSSSTLNNSSSSKNGIFLIEPRASLQDEVTKDEIYDILNQVSGGWIVPPPPAAKNMRRKSLIGEEDDEEEIEKEKNTKNNKNKNKKESTPIPQSSTSSSSVDTTIFCNRWYLSAESEKLAQQQLIDQSIHNNVKQGMMISTNNNNNNNNILPPATAFALLSSVCGGDANNSTSLKIIQSVSRWITPLERNHVLTQALLDAEVRFYDRECFFHNHPVNAKNNNQNSISSLPVSGSHPFVEKMSIGEAWQNAIDAESQALFSGQCTLTVLETLDDGGNDKRRRNKIKSLFAPQDADSVIIQQQQDQHENQQQQYPGNELTRAKQLLSAAAEQSHSNNNNSNNSSSSSSTSSTTPIALLIVHRRPAAHRAFATSFPGSKRPSGLLLRTAAQLYEELGGGGGRGMLMMMDQNNDSNTDKKNNNNFDLSENETGIHVANFCKWLVETFNHQRNNNKTMTMQELLATSVPSTVANALFDYVSQHPEIISNNNDNDVDHDLLMTTIESPSARSATSTSSQTNNASSASPILQMIQSKQEQLLASGGGASGNKKSTAAASSPHQSPGGAHQQGGGANAKAAHQQQLLEEEAARQRLSLAPRWKDKGQRASALSHVLRDLSFVAEETLELHPSDGSSLGVSITSPCIGLHRATWKKDDVLASLSSDNKNNRIKRQRSTNNRFLASFSDGAVVSIENNHDNEKTLFFQRGEGATLSWSTTTTRATKTTSSPSSNAILHASPLIHFNISSSSSSVKSLNVIFAHPQTRTIQHELMSETSRFVDTRSATVTYVARGTVVSTSPKSSDQQQQQPDKNKNKSTTPMTITTTSLIEVKISLHPDGKIVTVASTVVERGKKQQQSGSATNEEEDVLFENTTSSSSSSSSSSCLITLPSGRRCVSYSSSSSFSSFIPIATIASTKQFDMEHASNMTCNENLSALVTILPSSTTNNTRRNNNNKSKNDNDTVAAFGSYGVTIATCNQTSTITKYQLSFEDNSGCPGLVIDRSAGKNNNNNQQQDDFAVSAFYNDGTILTSSSSTTNDSNKNQQQQQQHELSTSKCFALYRPSGSCITLDAASGLIFTEASSHRIVEAPSLHYSALAAGVFIVDLDSASAQLIEHHQPFLTRITLPGGRASRADIDAALNDGMEMNYSSPTGDANIDGDDSQLRKTVFWRPNALLYPHLGEQYDSCVAIRRPFDPEEELIRFSGQGFVVPPSGKLAAGGHAEKERVQEEVARTQAILGIKSIAAESEFALLDVSTSMSFRNTVSWHSLSLTDKLLRVTVDYIKKFKLLEYETVRQRIARARRGASSMLEQLLSINNNASTSTSTSSVHDFIASRFPHIFSSANSNAAKIVAEICQLLRATPPKASASSTALFVLHADGTAHRHLTAREALHHLLQRCCDPVPLPHVSVSRAVVAGEDAVEKWMFSFDRNAEGRNNNAQHDELSERLSSTTATTTTTQLWSGAPLPIAVSPSLLLPLAYRNNNNHINQQQKQKQKQKSSSASTSDSWSIIRFQPMSAEARFAVVQEAVQAQLAKERAFAYREQADVIHDPALAHKLEKARLDGERLLLTTMARNQERANQQQEQTYQQQKSVLPPSPPTSSSSEAAAVAVVTTPNVVGSLSPAKTVNGRNLITSTSSKTARETTNTKWSQVAVTPSDHTLRFAKLACGFRYARTLILKNNSSSPISFVVERTTGTTTTKHDAVVETKLLHEDKNDHTNINNKNTISVSSSSSSSNTRFVQVQNQRGTMNSHGGQAVITFIIDARGPRRITDCFSVHLDRPMGPSLPITVTADIFVQQQQQQQEKKNDSSQTTTTSDTSAGFVLDSSVKVLGRTL